MSPRRTPATQQRPAKRKQSTSVQEIAKPAASIRATRGQAERSTNTSIDHSTRRSTQASTKTAQAQARRLPKPATINSNSIEPFRQPSTAPASLTGPLQSAKRKREHKLKLKLEDEPSGKRQRTDSGTVGKWIQKLSETNLEEHNSQTRSETFEAMGERKRTLSTRSSFADMSQEAASVSSQKATSLANYRYKNLDNARMVIDDGPIPNNIDSRVDAIIHPEISTELETDLARITATFCNEFDDVLRGASREDDSVEPIHRALTSIDGKKEFMFPRKADWDVTLKPDSQRKPFHLDILVRLDDAADDSPNRPSKRQQAETSYVSPDNSEPIVPPPPPPPKHDIYAVKTPRPDITVGVRDTVVIRKMKAHGLRALEAKDFLKNLQYQTLCSNALQPSYPMCFPPMVIEGKAYATGRPIFEAQNQAAVSGSCMINLQHQLAKLTELASPGSYQGKDPLAFSICTEGTIMQLWVHYITSVDNIHIYNMSALKICQISPNPFLREGVLEFFKAVSGVMRWATSELVDEIVKQLVLVRKSGKQRTT